MNVQSPAPELPLLLVDDNPQNLRLAGFLLRSDGFQVRTAESAEKAFELLSTERFSLVLMDIQLPGMDGLELTRIIRNTPALEDLIVVALTAYAMCGDEARMKAAGCDGHISKPIDTRSFPGTVRGYLGARAGDSEAAIGPEIARLREEWLIQVGSELRTLLALPDIDLGGPATFSALHRWAGFAGSVGLANVTVLAREAEQSKGQTEAGSRVRPALNAILAFLESLG
jgi:two-component system cell cycle response regulator DivK